MAGSKKGMANINDLDSILDDIGIERGSARNKAKDYCIDRLSDAEGKCLPANDIRVMASSFYDGYVDAMMMR